MLMLVTGRPGHVVKDESDQKLFSQAPCVNSGEAVNVRLLQPVSLEKGSYNVEKESAHMYIYKTLASGDWLRRGAAASVAPPGI